jgi:hypothetical protein
MSIELLVFGCKTIPADNEKKHSQDTHSNICSCAMDFVCVFCLFTLFFLFFVCIATRCVWMRVYFLRFLSIKITKKVKDKIFDSQFRWTRLSSVWTRRYMDGILVSIMNRIVFITENKKFNMTPFGTVS